MPFWQKRKLFCICLANNIVLNNTYVPPITARRIPDAGQAAPFPDCSLQYPAFV